MKFWKIWIGLERKQIIFSISAVNTISALSSYGTAMTFLMASQEALRI